MSIKALGRSRFNVMICLSGDVASHHFIPTRPDSSLSGGAVNLVVLHVEVMPVNTGQKVQRLSIPK